MSEQALFAPVCSIASTKRRRFLWAVWLAGPPVREPFRKPDAHAGGARTREEAMKEAARATGRSLVEIEPRWAKAWGRILVGQPAWLPGHEAGETQGASPRAQSEDREEGQTVRSLWTVLAIDRTATLVEIKKAYKQRALETHPDRGGTVEAFREVIRAYQLAIARRKRPAAKRPR